MRRNDQYLSETDIRSQRAKTWPVRASTRDRRRWLAGAPVCPLLKQYHIVHLGTASMPLRFRRPMLYPIELGVLMFLLMFNASLDGRYALNNVAAGFNCSDYCAV
jgi:hypothetical protein